MLVNNVSFQIKIYFIFSSSHLSKLKTTKPKLFKINVYVVSMVKNIIVIIKQHHYYILR